MEKKKKYSSQDLHETWCWCEFLCMLGLFGNDMIFFNFFDKVTFFNRHIYHFFLLFYFNLNLYIAFTIPVSCGGILASTNQEFSGQNTCIARTQRQVGLELETTKIFVMGPFQVNASYKTKYIYIVLIFFFLGKLLFELYNFLFKMFHLKFKIF